MAAGRQSQVPKRRTPSTIFTVLSSPKLSETVRTLKVETPEKKFKCITAKSLRSPKFPSTWTYASLSVQTGNLQMFPKSLFRKLAKRLRNNEDYQKIP